MHDYVRLSFPYTLENNFTEDGLGGEILDSDVAGLFQERYEEYKGFFFFFFFFQK